jgi:uncharacterized membrane protein
LQFEYYTSLTPAQCASALNKRIEQKETASRPKVTGKATKDSFVLTVKMPVIWNFERRTSLKATLTRDKGTTVINGFVNIGGTRQQQRLIFIGGIVVGLGLIAMGYFLQGVLVGVVGAAMYIPLEGDAHNSAYLLKQVQSLLKAKARDPR